jgi:membrane-bound serine protease (ClpP class)
MAHRHSSAATRQTARRAAAALSVPVMVVCLAVVATLTSWASPQTGPLHSASAQAEARAATTGGGQVWVTKVGGIVDPALAGYLTGTMKSAADAGAAALVIELDTPGGLDTSMRQIIQAELDSPVPIIFYVYPQGARAASAGVYILMASDVAVMAPQTNIGAATPVSLTGSMDDTMKAKVTNDAAAYMRGLATSHNRNADWAEQAVREAVSLPSNDALQQKVVDFIAPDLSTLLKTVDGFVTSPKGLTLHTADATIKEVKMGWIAGFLHAIANPDLAYILMIIGVLGIVFELAHPGIGAAGVSGVIALILAFYSFQVLPVNWAGIILIVAAFIMFVAELKIQSHGALGIGGTVALIFGGLLLFPSGAPFLRVDWAVLIVVALLALGFFTLVIRKVAMARRRPRALGVESMVGATGVVTRPLSPEGQVRIHGENWRARSEGADLLKEQEVEVVATEGLTLVVRPAQKEGV